MSQLAPSFHALYRQARPPRPRGRKLMEQRERFATACLAFVLQHDPHFRGTFLRTVCGYDGQMTSANLNILLEVPDSLNNKRWDLVLSIGEEAVFIVEVKIDAQLDPAQDPKGEDFFRSGYGHGIIETYPSYKARTYILLWQNDETLADKQPIDLRCLAKHWQLLGKPTDNLPRSSLVHDLFKSLGSFNVRCFAILNPMTDRLKLSGDAFAACKVHALLGDIVSYLKEYLGLPYVKDSSLFQVDGGYVGWDVTRKAADKKWLSLIAARDGKPTDEISWFGYDLPAGHLNVGFYCDSTKAKVVHGALKRCTVGLGRVCIDKGYVWIESDGSFADGDKEWFRAIYDRMSDQAKL